MKSFGFLCLLFACSSCITTELSRRGEKVRVTSNSNVVEECRFLKEVEGSDHLNGGAFGQGAAETNARRRMMNTTAQIGGNVVLLSSSNAGIGGASFIGEAYYCEPDMENEDADEEG